MITIITAFINNIEFAGCNFDIGFMVFISSNF